MRILTPLRDDRGVTLPEMLVGLAVGTIIVLAAYNVLDMALRTQSAAEARIDSVQKGREVTNRLGSLIRSQTCNGNLLPSISQSTPTTLQLTTSVTRVREDLGYQPLQRQTLTYDPTRSRVTLTTVEGVGSPPNTTFTGTATTRTLAEDVRLDSTTPFFRYYSLAGTPPAPVLLNPSATGDGLAQAVRATITRIEINFLIRSLDASATSAFTRYTGAYWARTADPAFVPAGSGCK